MSWPGPPVSTRLAPRHPFVQRAAWRLLTTGGARVRIGYIEPGGVELGSRSCRFRGCSHGRFSGPLSAKGCVLPHKNYDAMSRVLESATHPGDRLVPDRLGDAAPAARGPGPPGPGAAV